MKEIPTQLRKLAESLRKKAQEIEHSKIVKSAQVLIAAQGLSRFEEILNGDAK